MRKLSPLAVTFLAALLAAGCGEEAAPEAAPAPRAGDPTLRGLVAFLKTQGLAIGEPISLAPDADQKARLGSAVGLANELAGAGIASDLATETTVRQVERLTVTFQRYGSAERAEAAATKQRGEEAVHTDAGKIVILAEGDNVVAVRGPGGTASGFDRMTGIAPRPSGAPPAELVEKLGAGLRAFHGLGP